MAVNLEIIGRNVLDISLPNNDKIKPFQNDSIDAEMIVKDILREIFDTAVKKSEESQIDVGVKKYRSIENIEIEASDLIDLTRNYKQEFGTILRNLKCQSHKTQPSSNASLENQIKKVIEEIRSLETSVRSNINQEGGDIDVMSEDDFKGNKNQLDNKSGFTNFLNDCTNGKAPQAVYIGEEINDELVVQVIDLQVDSETSSSYNNQFPSEEELEDIILNDNILNQGDRFNTPVTSKVLSSSAGGETTMQNPVPEPEPDEKLLPPQEDTIRRKKGLGSRLMQFFRKNRSSLVQRNNTTQ